jgi:hypothetical protein
MAQISVLDKAATSYKNPSGRIFPASSFQNVVKMRSIEVPAALSCQKFEVQCLDVWESVPRSAKQKLQWRALNVLKASFVEEAPKLHILIKFARLTEADDAA